MLLLTVPDVDPVQVIWMVWLAIYLVACFVTGILIAKRRNTDALLARSPIGMSVQLFASAVLMSMICAREYDRESFPCAAYIVMMQLFVPVFFLPVFFRASSLDYTHRYRLVDGGEDDEHRRAPVAEYANNQRLRKGNLLILSAVICMLHLIMLGIQLGVAASQGDLSDGCEWSSVYDILPLAMMAGAYAIGFLVMLIRLHRVHDILHIAHELRLGFTAALVCVSAFFVTNIIPLLWQLDDYFPFVTFIVLMLVSLHVIFFFYPIHLSGKTQYANAFQMTIDRSLRSHKHISDYLYDQRSAWPTLESWAVDQKTLHALEHFLLASSYVDSVEKVRSHQVAKRIYDYVHSAQVCDANREALSYVASQRMLGVLDANGVPTTQQMESYLEVLTENAQRLVVDPFTRTAEYEAMLESLRIQSSTAMLYRVQSDQNACHTYSDEI